MTLATVAESSVTTTTTDAPTFATVDAKAFAGLLTDVALFASKDETLPALCAVQLQRGTVDGEPVIVARSTDRFALAESWIPCDGGTVWPEATVLISIDAVKQILGVLKATPRGGMAIVTVNKDDKRGVLTINVDNFRAQTTVFCSDADFPRSVKSLWPTGSDVVPTVRTFGPAIMTRPAAVAKRRSEPLRIHWDGKRNGGVLMTTGHDFRVLVMTYRDENEGDSYTFAEPSYS